MNDTAPPPTATASKVATVLRVTSGNFLEMYDFFLFGYYATHIAKAFFPASSEFASLMFTFMTFGAGFLMRPLGAVILGAYVDRIGRRRGLVVTLSIMAAGTMLLAFVPGYATIGLAAPLLVLVGRLLQGFSAGVELGGVSVYLSEMATPGHKGFYVSWQSASQQLAIVLISGLGYALDKALTPGALAAWGWRVPFFVGCLIVPVILIIRRSLEETGEFLARSHRPDLREACRSLLAHWVVIVGGMLLVITTTVSFYLITIYPPTYAGSVLKLAAADGKLATLFVGVSNFVWLPVMGALSDRIGRRPILIAFAALTLLTSYPAMSWLAATPSSHRMLLVYLWLSLLYGSYNGAMVVALTEVMPAHVRTVGFSLAYSLATALFGGFSPAIVTWLIQVTGDRGAPGLWMSFAAACGLIGAWILYRRGQSASHDPIPSETEQREADRAARPEAQRG